MIARSKQTGTGNQKMPKLETIQTQIKSLLPPDSNVNIDILFLYHPAFHCLTELLEEEESIKAYCIGLLEGSHKKYPSGKWLLVKTSKRYLFIFKSMVKTSFEHFALDFKNIQKITYNLGWFFGKIQFTSESNTITLLQIGKRDFRFYEECQS